jgi:hypothetical protein
MAEDIGAAPTIKVVDPCTGHHDLGNGAHQVSRHLGLPVVMPSHMHKRNGDNGGPHEFYLLVVSSPEEARLGRSAVERYPICGVVAWLLPEGAAVDLVQLSVPVYFGLPDPQKWAEDLLAPVDTGVKDRDSQICSQLAILESQLAGHQGAGDEI